MLKKRITYRNLNDETVEKDFYFHLSKAEIIEMELTAQGGLKAHLERVMEAQDGEEVVKFLRRITLGAYGKRSEDGADFIKTPELTAQFEASEAFSELLMEVCTNADQAAAFVNGIVPKGLAEDVARIQAEQAQRPPNRAERRHPSDTAAQAPPAGPRPEASSLADRIHEAGPPQPAVEVPEVRVLTRQELTEMDEAELRSGLAEGRFKLQ